jgi:hypothetical protein
LRNISTLGNTQIPDWGVADLEVKMFQHLNNPTGNPGFDAQNTDGGPAPMVASTKPIYDNVFGIAVTSKVFTGAHPKTSFSRGDIAGILTGNVSDWSQLAADDGTQLAAGGIIFLDRVEGSGTKAAGNQYFLDYPGSITNIVNPVALAPFSAATPYNGTSLGTVATEQPLDIAERDPMALVNDLVLAQSRGLRAIAVLDLDKAPAHHLAVGDYEFVRIDGVGVDTGTAGDDINGTVATSYIQVVKGNYEFYYQGSFNTRSGVLSGTTVGDLFANEFLAVFSQMSFVCANTGRNFPSSACGRLADSDYVPFALTNGVVISSRNRLSPAPLLNIIPVPSTGLPVSKEPL